MKPLPYCTERRVHVGGQTPFINTDTNTRWCTVNFTNKYWLYTNTNIHTCLVHISDQENVNQFCYWNVNFDNDTVNITQCSEVGIGYLQIQGSIFVPITFYDSTVVKYDPKLIYQNYQKDNFCKNLGYKSHVAYLESLIDELIVQQDSMIVKENMIEHTVSHRVSSVVSRRSSAILTHLSCLSDVVVNDHNNPSKTRGFPCQ